jgi:hypothetical protein
VAFTRVSKGQGTHNGRDNLGAVAQEEKEQVEHQEEQDAAVERVLADIERLCAQKATDGDGGPCQPLFEVLCLNTKPIQVMRHNREQTFKRLDRFLHIDVPGFETLIERGGFIHHGQTD